MTDTVDNDAPAAAPEIIAAAPGIVAALPVDPVDPVDPLVAERARSAAILAAVKPEFSALAALAVAGGWSANQFVAAQAASACAVATARADAATGAFRDSLPAPIAAGGGADKTPLDPAAEFSASAALKAEFSTEGKYLAYCQAVADGKVRNIKRA